MAIHEWPLHCSNDLTGGRQSFRPRSDRHVDLDEYADTGQWRVCLTYHGNRPNRLREGAPATIMNARSFE